MTLRFLDTNILLYSISRDATETVKRDRAVALIDAGGNALSVQVLQEFYVQATRASRPDPITHQQAVRLIESFRRFPVQDVTSAILMAALATRRRWSAYVLGGSLAVFVLTLVPFIFPRFADAVSLSQARREGGFLPFAFALVGGAAVLARVLRWAVLPVAAAAGVSPMWLITSPPVTVRTTAAPNHAVCRSS